MDIFGGPLFSYNLGTPKTDLNRWNLKLCFPEPQDWGEALASTGTHPFDLFHRIKRDRIWGIKFENH